MPSWRACRPASSAAAESPVFDPVPRRVSDSCWVWEGLPPVLHVRMARRGGFTWATGGEGDERPRAVAYLTRQAALTALRLARQDCERMGILNPFGY